MPSNPLKWITQKAKKKKGGGNKHNDEVVVTCDMDATTGIYFGTSHLSERPPLPGVMPTSASQRVVASRRFDRSRRAIRSLSRSAPGRLSEPDINEHIYSELEDEYHRKASNASVSSTVSTDTLYVIPTLGSSDADTTGIDDNHNLTQLLRQSRLIENTDEVMQSLELYDSDLDRQNYIADFYQGLRNTVDSHHQAVFIKTGVHEDASDSSKSDQESGQVETEEKLKTLKHDIQTNEGDDSTTFPRCADENLDGISGYVEIRCIFKDKVVEEALNAQDDEEEHDYIDVLAEDKSTSREGREADVPNLNADEIQHDYVNVK